MYLMAFESLIFFLYFQWNYVDSCVFLIKFLFKINCFNFIFFFPFILNHPWSRRLKFWSLHWGLWGRRVEPRVERGYRELGCCSALYICDDGCLGRISTSTCEHLCLKGGNGTWRWSSAAKIEVFTQTMAREYLKNCSLDRKVAFLLTSLLLFEWFAG